MTDISEHHGIRHPGGQPNGGRPVGHHADAPRLIALVRLLAREAAREAMHAARANREEATDDEG